MPKNVFVLGLDELNAAILRGLPDAEDYTFHQLLTKEHLQHGTIDVLALLREARRVLDAFTGTVDAVVGFWDFPVSMMVPVLCRRYGLRSASLEAVVKCEHKYWSRLVQQEVIEEYPAFGLLDLTAEPARLPEHLRYPVWVKPIKSASSEGAYHVADDEQLQQVRDLMRMEVQRVGGPFNDILDMLDLPAAVADVGGDACIVEEAARGHQFTVEGFSSGGAVHTYGLVDSVHYPGYPSFLRYQYPSRLPPHVRERAAQVTGTVITAVGLDSSTFNIEYFWDPDTDRLVLLEINARHSQSHALLFQLVDGTPNHAAMLDLALGREPDLPRREGPHAAAAKWFVRHFSDGVVRRVPTAAELAALTDRLPGVTVRVTVTEGDRLSAGYGEDSYSYVLAEVYTAGRDEAELVATYERCVAGLAFEIDDVAAPLDAPQPPVPPGPGEP